MHCSLPSTRPRSVPYGRWSVPDLPGWDLQLITHPDQLSEWPSTTRDTDFWLRRATLNFLLSGPTAVQTEAVVCTEQSTGRRVMLTAQTFKFTPDHQVNGGAVTQTSRYNFRKRLLGLFPSQVLVLGQLFTSGDYAVDGLDRIPPEQSAALLVGTAEAFLLNRKGYRAVLIKDADVCDSLLDAALQRFDYQPLRTEPVMLLSIDRYESIEDYLAHLTSKYRVRYRRARSKMGDLTRHKLSVEQVAQLLPEIFDLYLETSAGADFNLAPLSADYFRWLGGVGRIDGYFTSQWELIGFTTGITNGSVYQAHYLGVREAYKYTHHLYHNMLFDLVSDGIVAGCDTVDLGRTATEIKSSVGAEPRDYATLLKLCSPQLNRLVPRFAAALFQPTAYQIRTPFRTE